MSLEEYFGKWLKVLDKKELVSVLSKIRAVPRHLLCPSLPNVFKAFELCPYDKCRAVFIGQDPYPQTGVATGILFGNKRGTLEKDLSPSLRVIKESVVDFEVPHNFITFDDSLESWARQGVLMLNSALTCEANKVSSHAALWRPLMAKLVYKLSNTEPGLVYVLFGNRAKTLKPYINTRFNDVVETGHPAHFHRLGQKMPHHVWDDVNRLLKGKNDSGIVWFEELDA